MNLISVIPFGYRNSFRWNARAGRKEFWYWQLFIALSWVLFFGILLMVSTVVGTSSPAVDVTTTVFVVLFWLLLLVNIPATVAVFVRRLHDRNHSAWFALWLLLPIGQIIVLIIFVVILASGSEPNDNKWGAPAAPVQRSSVGVIGS